MKNTFCIISRIFKQIFANIVNIDIYNYKALNNNANKLSWEIWL